MSYNLRKKPTMGVSSSGNSGLRVPTMTSGKSSSPLTTGSDEVDRLASGKQDARNGTIYARKRQSGVHIGTLLPARLDEDSKRGGSGKKDEEIQMTLRGGRAKPPKASSLEVMEVEDQLPESSSEG